MKLITDCAADLLPEEAEALGVSVVPLYIHFPEETIDAMTISPDAFYERLAALYPTIPTTSLPAPDMFIQMYRGFLAEGGKVLSLHISSGLSGTLNSASVAAQEFGDNLVKVIDSLTLSGGLRFQVVAAAKAIKAGWEWPAIRQRLDEVRQHSEVIYTLETLEYLAAGGRIGRVQALAGSMLKLKPIINVDKQDGKYNTLSKTRTMKRALAHIADHLAEQYPSGTPLTVTVLHGQIEREAKRLKALLAEKLTVAKAEIRRISPVLGVHTGPGIVGAAVVPSELLAIS
jgi:DegV family protein with EDD domain